MSDKFPLPAGTGFAAVVGQSKVTAALQRAIARDRLPHALLFTGPNGVGKATTALILAQALNCKVNGPADACGECAACSKIARGIHPDVLWVAPVRRSIGIAWITPRANPPKDAPDESDTVTRFVGYTPYEGRWRVVIIDSAHSMTREAQNALLKTLEEPPASTKIVLATSSPGTLLPTIHSRCQALPFSPVGNQAIRDYLVERLDVEPQEASLRAALSPGSIGRALAVDLDEYQELLETVVEALRLAQHGGGGVVSAAESLNAPGVGMGDTSTQRAASVLRVARDVLRDLLVVASGAEGAQLVNAGQREAWNAWAADLDEQGLVGALEALQHGLGRFARTEIQPNIKLALESTLIDVGARLRGESTAA